VNCFQRRCSRCGKRSSDGCYLQIPKHARVPRKHLFGGMKIPAILPRDNPSARGGGVGTRQAFPASALFAGFRCRLRSLTRSNSRYCIAWNHEEPPWQLGMTVYLPPMTVSDFRTTSKRNDRTCTCQFRRLVSRRRNACSSWVLITP
jgi:hypothetical protein